MAAWLRHHSETIAATSSIALAAHMVDRSMHDPPGREPEQDLQHLHGAPGSVMRAAFGTRRQIPGRKPGPAALASR